MFGLAVTLQIELLALVAALSYLWVFPRAEVVQLALDFFRPLAIGVGEQRKVGSWFGRSVHGTHLALGSGGSVPGVGPGVAVSGVGFVVVNRVSWCRVGVVILPQVSEKVKNTKNLPQKVQFAPVAQLDRASVFGTEGWGFESLRCALESHKQ